MQTTAVIGAPSRTCLLRKTQQYMPRKVNVPHLQRCRPVRFKEGEKDVGEETKETLRDVRDTTKANAERGYGEFKSSLQQASTTPEYAPTEPKYNPLMFSFTRRREIFAGRLAMLGFFAACFWEWYLPSHPNVLEQISGAAHLINIPLGTGAAGVLLGALVLINATTGLAPGSATYDIANQRDIAQRPKGLPWTLEGIRSPNQVFGVTRWGFSKANELFHGRIAMLGFAGVVLNQLRFGGVHGPGPLAQFAAFTGSFPDSTFYSSVPLLFIGWSILCVVLAAVNNNMGTLQGENEIY